MKVALIMGNQLHRDHPALSDSSVDAVVMIEAKDICGKLPYHKHKLVLILSAMRHYAEFAKNFKKKIFYYNIDQTPKFLEALDNIVKTHRVTEIAYMQPPEIKTHSTLQLFCKKRGIITKLYQSKLFITPPSDMEEWRMKGSQGNMEQFYRWQRKQTGYLMDEIGPVGGRWNFDEDNRKPLPKQIPTIPSLIKITFDTITESVITTVDMLYPNNPGRSSDFWLPTTHREADEWLTNFVASRLKYFGKYEDAMATNEPFLYHSVLSPLMNCGLLDPAECVQAAIHAYEIGVAPLNSVEGFVRQIIGWREYMYIMYTKMLDFRLLNFFGFTKDLEKWWYVTGADEHGALPLPVRQALGSAHNYGYNHHIERLMVLGNWFLLNNYSPMSAFQWFSSMYVDAYEWIMVPNVIGMSQYADGGKVATKPYISGGNYLKKMGRWDNIQAKDLQQFTDLYWLFLSDNYKLLRTNHRMSLVLKRVKP